MFEFIRTTDKTAAVMCFGDREEDCGVWATLYLYEARGFIHMLLIGARETA
jgi:hypothetical protein